MKKILVGAIAMLLIVVTFQYCQDKKDTNDLLQSDTVLIEKQIANVGKLVVTEGSYAQVFTYKDTDKLFGFLDANKKALVVVNAEASISYDLSKITAQIDPEVKTVTITRIPEPELRINPNIEYYDISQDYLNQFEAADYNKIKKRIEASLREKIEASELQTNAQNRLISELQKIYLLTNAMGWKLQYNKQEITSENNLNTIKL